jgi:hypothetical protein
LSRRERGSLVLVMSQSQVSVTLLLCKPGRPWMKGVCMLTLPNAVAQAVAGRRGNPYG